MMATPALLELLAHTVRGHATRGPSDTTRVVRVVMVDPEIDSDESEGLTHLLAGVASYWPGARAVHADSAATHFDSGGTDPELRGALTTAAAHLETRPEPPIEVAFDDSGVRIADKELDVLSKGEREFIGVLAALLNPDWRGTHLGIVTYSEESMDAWLTRAAWAAVSVALDGKRISDMESLIIIVRCGEVDTAMHCADRWGAEWVIQYDRLVRRGSLESARQHAREVVRASSKPTVLYLGAGFSLSSGLPSGDELRDRALREYFTADPDAPVEPLARRLFQGALQADKLSRDQLNDGEDGFVRSFTLEDVIALVKELTTEPPPTLAFFAQRHGDAAAGPAVRDLAQIVDAVKGLVIVTVNFDELVERECGDGSVLPVVTEEQFDAFPDYLQRYLAGDEASVPVVKLHGTISMPESCVVSALQTRIVLAAPKAEALRAIAKSVAAPPHSKSVAAPPRSNWIYIGTSMRDRDIVPVLKEPELADAFDESWVMPLRPAGVDRLGDHRALQWQEGRASLDKRTFSISADAFMHFMVEAAAAS